MRVEFLTELRVAKRSGGSWRTLDPFAARVWPKFGDAGAAEITKASPIVVPAGFETDFASVPRLPFVYLVAGDVCHRAPLLHDYLYGQGTLERAWCDRIFLEAMRAEGVSWWRCQVMHRAVRLAGGSHFKRAEQ